MNETEIFSDKRFLTRLGALLEQGGITLFEYRPEKDELTVYDKNLNPSEKIPGYLKQLLKDPQLSEDDRRRAEEFYHGKLRGPMELDRMEDGKPRRKQIDASLIPDGEASCGGLLIGCMRDITVLREREHALENLAKRDSLTGLYNHTAGRKLINDYLCSKDPYAACGLMVIDVDYFKNVNDIYGHLFGDQVLKRLAELLREIFDPKDVLIRAGGDEFVVLMKDISHAMLVKRATMLTGSVREAVFPERDYRMTCSIGVCFLPENAGGCSYEQLFENADWALYRSKENGRNQCTFCDSLKRFEQAEQELEKEEAADPDIDTRYLRNDIVSTAFEIFEKAGNFDQAIQLLLRVIGIRFRLDRITIIRTDIKEQSSSRSYQWTAKDAPEALTVESEFTKEDFLTLFRSYDEYGTTVLQYDDLDMYSAGARRLLMQGEAKTVVYAAIYSEGRYTGAISYVVCRNKRFWSRQNRKELGELTKIIAAHLVRSQALNAFRQDRLLAPEYDRLTGLLAFSRFREELEQKIVSGYAASHMVVYSDIDNFKYFNQKYGYTEGDELLKEYSRFVIEQLSTERDIYFSRIVSDQFVIALPSGSSREKAVAWVRGLNEKFTQMQTWKYPKVRLRIRSGIYFIEPECMSASEAIDAANFARKQIPGNEVDTVLCYTEEMGQLLERQHEMLNEMSAAMDERAFRLYLQPKISLKDGSLTGAEALVRWERDGRVRYYPAQFIPLYEEHGRIAELDFYMFELTMEFHAYCREHGCRPLPVSINASVFQADDLHNVERYEKIRDRYQIPPELIEVELAETAAVSRPDSVKQFFHRLQERGMRTALDDFGAGYSVMNMVMDIPVNTIKMDRSFIKNCWENEKGFFFIRQIVSLFQGLGCKVISEGVETEEQAELMKRVGCDDAQGYYFAKPMPWEEFCKRYLSYSASDSHCS